MRLDWTPVRTEIKAWHAAGLELPIWWRDDDAVAPTRALDRLMTIAGEMALPLHLAIIPRDATKELAALVKGSDDLVAVVHGWAHRNHQPDEDQKCEFGDARPQKLRREEAAEGLRRLQTLMGDSVAPMFVPPWNRVPEDFLPDLADMGYTSFSTCNPRPAIEPVEGLVQINTHVDPLYWRPSKNLSDPELFLGRIADLLRQRREGETDIDEPFGLLTHHKVHSEHIWEFCRQYWSEIKEAPTRLYQAGQQ